MHSNKYVRVQTYMHAHMHTYTGTCPYAIVCGWIFLHLREHVSYFTLYFRLIICVCIKGSLIVKHP